MILFGPLLSHFNVYIFSAPSIVFAMHDMTLESRIQYKNNNRLPVIHFFKDMVLEATVANSKQITSTGSKQKQRRLTSYIL